MNSQEMEELAKSKGFFPEITLDEYTVCDICGENISSKYIICPVCHHNLKMALIKIENA